MELAIGINFDGNDFVCRTVSTRGETSSLPLNELHKRGLPEAKKNSRCRVDTNFANWRKVNASEYVRAFGLQLPDATSDEHQFYETEVNGRRFVIPALALMRALFRPARHFLPAMFHPQALDQIGRIKPSKGALEVEIDANWGKVASARQAGAWKTTISWLFAHPSAFLTAGSVHTNARAGRIDLSLPEAEARIVFTGLKAAEIMFVVDACVMAVTPFDKPVYEVIDLPETFVLHNSALGKPKRVEVTVPFHADGTTALTDVEWKKVESIICASRQKAKSSKLSQRDLFDGMLGKLATNHAWREIDYKVGTWVNASALFQRLLKRGVLPEILGVLGESRTAN